MHAARAEALGKAGGQQQAAKGKEELARAKVAARIQDIYQATKQKVEARLKTLDDSVGSLFDKGAEQAAQDFTSHLDARFSVWRAERYGSNPALWLLDKIKGPPQEVDKFFVEARNLYVKRMDAVIDKVAAAVQAGLAEAKALVGTGWQEVQAYIQGLPVDLRKVGQQAGEQIQGSFDQLRQSIDDRRDQLIDRLAQKYVESLNAIDERIRQKKEENKGLFDEAKAAMGGVIETIRNLRQMLLNVLAKAAAVVKKIVKDPIGFLRNLIAGVKQGLQRFAGNIVGHLQKGLMGWLFGALGEAGLEVPEKLDLRGIIGLALQVLGVTYAFFRKRAAALLGEPVVHRLEQVAEVFKVLVTEGAAGLWRFIKDKVGDIKSMVVDGIMSFVRNSIIIAGLTWVLSLLNPASAFVKACKLIYDIIMFFVERGSQIMALVNAIIGSVQAIAAGAIGVAAAAVENALGKAVPVAISFLASLLGLTGVGKAVRKIIEKAQAPVGKAMDWLIHQAAKLIKKAGGFVKGLFGSSKKGKKADDRTEQRKKHDLDQAIIASAAVIKDNKLTKRERSRKISKLRGRFRLESLEIVSKQKSAGKEKVHVHGRINPTAKTPEVEILSGGVIEIRKFELDDKTKKIIFRKDDEGNLRGTSFEGRVFSQLYQKPKGGVLAIEGSLGGILGERIAGQFPEQEISTVDVASSLTVDKKSRRKFQRERDYIRKTLVGASTKIAYMIRHFRLADAQGRKVRKARKAEKFGIPDLGLETVSAAVFVEITLITDVDKAADQYAIRKSGQIYDTVMTLKKKYRHLSMVEYHITTPEPSGPQKEKTVSFINAVHKAAKMKKKLKIVWNILC
jgi:hypothetical protein